MQSGIRWSIISLCIIATCGCSLKREVITTAHSGSFNNTSNITNCDSISSIVVKEIDRKSDTQILIKEFRTSTTGDTLGEITNREITISHNLNATHKTEIESIHTSQSEIVGRGTSQHNSTNTTETQRSSKFTDALIKVVVALVLFIVVIIVVIVIIKRVL